MVYTEAAVASFAPKLYQASKRWILNSFTSATELPDPQQKHDQQPSQPQKSQAPAASTEYLVYNWLEALFAWFQVIILWHEPFVSLCVLSGLLSSFLLLTYFAPRFYATIMIALFIYNANKFWFKHVWPAIRVPPEQGREEEMILDVDRWTYLHPQLMTLAEFTEHSRNLKNIVENFIKSALELRQNNHIKFYMFVTSILSITAYVGNRISGINLIFLCITVLLTSPGFYQYLLPDSAKKWIHKRLSCVMILKNPQSAADLVTTSSPRNSEPPTVSRIESIDASVVPPPVSTLVSKARNIEQQAFSLFEHFKRKKSGSEDSEANPKGSTNFGNIDATPTSSNVPTSNEQSQSNHDNGQEQELNITEAKNDLRSQQEPKKSSDEMSSNDSVSLIDSDDDQQDGFVLL